MLLLGGQGGRRCTAAPGTLGLLVRNAGNTRYILTCSHVAAESGQFGDFKDLADSQRVIVSCLPERRIGLLTETYSKLEVGKDNPEDCALVELGDEALATVSPVQRITGERIREVATEPAQEWEKGTPTRLLGAMRLDQDDATGSITEFRERIDMPYPGVGNITLTNVVLYTTNSEKGDSGGAVIDSENRLLGMHLGGDPSERIGVFLPLKAYMDQHGLKLVSD